MDLLLVSFNFAKFHHCRICVTDFKDGAFFALPYPKESYDKRVRVMFQEKAWCDENIMKEWINTEWSNRFTNPLRTKKILIGDVHLAQQTDYVKALLTKKMTSLCNDPPGSTSRVQVVDVTVNKPFKDDKHLELYVEGKLSASQRRILITKWVGEAWKKISGMKESIVRSFKKCGLPVALDGSENAQVIIDDIPSFKMALQYTILLCMNQIK